MDRLESSTLLVLTTPVSASVHSIMYKPLMRELTLRLEDEKAHATAPSYSGSTVFPYAGRIEDAVFRGCPLDRNDGRNSLHGGSMARAAAFERIKSTPDSVTYRTIRKNGDDMLEAEREYRVTYTLSEDTLLISHEMESDKAVITDTTCHLYFNLSGEDTVLNHRVSLDEDAVILNNRDHTPQKLIETAGTTFDLTEPTMIRDIVGRREFAFSKGLNNAYRLSGEKTLKLESDDITLIASSDSRAVVLYSGGYLNPPSSHLAVEFEDIPFREARTVTEKYIRHFSFRFMGQK